MINNNGNGTLSIGQNPTNVLWPTPRIPPRRLPRRGRTLTAMATWICVPRQQPQQQRRVIYYNDGTGQLSTTKSAVEASNATAGYLSVAVDWNGTGRWTSSSFSTYGSSQTATLFTNNGYGSTWTSPAGFGWLTSPASPRWTTTGDGAQDLLGVSAER